jgi:hypothetical protein
MTTIALKTGIYLCVALKGGGYSVRYKSRKTKIILFPYYVGIME